MVYVGTRGQSNEGHHWQVQGDGQDESARGAGILYILCPSIIAGITDKYKEMGKVGLHEAQVFYIYCALLLLLASLTSTRRWARWVCTRRRYFLYIVPSYYCWHHWQYMEMGKMTLHEAQVIYLYCAHLLITVLIAYLLIRSVYVCYSYIFICVFIHYA